MTPFQKAVYATKCTFEDQKQDIADLLVMPVVNCFLGKLAGKLLPKVMPSSFRRPPIGNTRFGLPRLLVKKTADGAVLAGADSRSWAKYALRKGLPLEENQKTLAVENDPHSVDDFDGIIESGYGKGTKTLLSSEEVIVKVKGKQHVAKINYHFHEADKAGPHFDLVVEGISPGSKEFELNISRGDIRGRYAFRQTDKGMIVIRMKDRTVRLDKPDYKLRPAAFLEEIVDVAPEQWDVTRKMDGAMSNVHIENGRAHFRSHRETENRYYDKLPAVEFLHNKSRLWSCRHFFPGPALDRTILQVELVHEDGASRVAGILNAHPIKARQIQTLRGNVKVFAWDLVQLKGKDVSHLPNRVRRQLLKAVVSEMRQFNKNWDVVESRLLNMTAAEYYQHVVSDSRGLPWSEGVVVRPAATQGEFVKIKASDTFDLRVVEFVEGRGKYAGSLGAIVVENEVTGDRGEVGSFRVTDEQRDWIWQNREALLNQVAEIEAMEMTNHGAGVPRAGRFVRWHPGKSEAALLMYSETLAGGNPEESREMLYKLKSAAGWKSR